jgi:NAD(P)-dependent dehydrogenase (short-subunit alcohol dehydrogenase family)
MRLKGKVATVTGGGRGIGEAIVQALAREGAAVVAADRDETNARKVARAVETAGGRAVALTIDVAEAADAERLAATAVERLGRLDIHVNCAGISINALFVDTPLEDWERVLRVNLTGAFLCGQAAARRMLERGAGGRIVNICSLSGQRGGTGRAAYGASKAGLELLTRVMAVELAESGINVNAIAPGPVDTELTKVVHDEATREAYRRLTPQRRYGLPSEIADATVFLASDESAYVTGHTLNVDGGFGAAGLMFRLEGGVARAF